MIETVTISAFKSIEDASVRLGQVNVLVGANGAGKSNLLEAIGVLGAAAEGRVDDGALLRRGVRPGVPAIYKSFKGSAMAPQIRLTAQGGGAAYDVSLQNPIKKPEADWNYFAELLTVGGETIVGRHPTKPDRGDTKRGSAALALTDLPGNSPGAGLLTSLRDYRIYTPDTHTLRGLVVDPQQGVPVGLSGGRLAERVQATLDALTTPDREEVREQVMELLGWVEDFKVGTSATVPMSPSVPTTPYVLEFRDRFMRNDRQVISGYDASEGAVLVLFLMVLARHPAAPRLFAVDNIDHGLNPRLAKAMTALVVAWLLQAGDRQAIFTAHNPLVLDGLPLRDERVRLFAVDRTNSGRTSLHRVIITPAMLEKAEKGQPISQMWVDGMFGGVPNV